MSSSCNTTQPSSPYLRNSTSTFSAQTLTFALFDWTHVLSTSTALIDCVSVQRRQLRPNLATSPPSSTRSIRASTHPSSSTTEGASCSQSAIRLATARTATSSTSGPSRAVDDSDVAEYCSGFDSEAQRAHSDAPDERASTAGRHSSPLRRSDGRAGASTSSAVPPASPTHLPRTAGLLNAPPRRHHLTNRPPPQCIPCSSSPRLPQSTPCCLRRPSILHCLVSLPPRHASVPQGEDRCHQDHHEEGHGNEDKMDGHWSAWPKKNWYPERRALASCRAVRLDSEDIA
ncbi:hypothetical protein FA95DRAFT_1567294 [Auriscalpium vulgare]|uniref:Uncharacterized protein n=1 Tax=Auriscalpium vulgare TaxID=40419 RepID=A0ACB8R511_9AGAM|nr:hypothetical protein FA95DRAFT_1567294 [Auriscalpium vulgare]